MLSEPAADGTEDLRFAAAVAAFGQLLGGSSYVEDFGYEDVVDLALTALGEDRHGYRAGFVDLVQIAASLDRH